MAGIFEAIKRGFGIATKNLGIVLIMIVFNLIGNVVSMPFAVPAGETPSAQLMAGAIIFTIVFILISVFIQGGAMGVVRDIIKEGRMKLASFASYGMKYYLRLLGLGALIILIIGIVASIAALVIAITVPVNNAIVTGIAVTIAIAIGVVSSLLFFIPLALAPYALICEDLGIISAMKRSLAVVKKQFIRVILLLLLFVLLILISLGIGLVIGFLVGIISALIPEGAGRVVMIVVTSVINGYLGIVMMASFMVYYLRLAAKPAEVSAKA